MMEIAYAAALIVSYLGMLLGIIIAHVSPEEKRPLRKYISISKKILLYAILAVSIYFSLHDTAGIAFSFIFVIYLLTGKDSDMAAYALLGILFFIASKDTEFLAAISSMIFLFGIPIGIQQSSKKILGNLKPIISNIGFIAMGLILPLLFL